MEKVVTNREIDHIYNNYSLNYSCAKRALWASFQNQFKMLTQISKTLTDVGDHSNYCIKVTWECDWDRDGRTQSKVFKAKYFNRMIPLSLSANYLKYTVFFIIITIEFNSCSIK